MLSFPPDSPMSTELSIPPHSLSIVVPFYNEEDNIAPLVKRVHEALVGYDYPWELVLVDDGSSDATVDRAIAVLARIWPARPRRRTDPQFQADRRHAGGDRCGAGRRDRDHGWRFAERPDRHSAHGRPLAQRRSRPGRRLAPEPPGRPVPAQDSVKDRQQIDRPDDRRPSA
jgi:glycosyltransferase involved in cell wall biosynthesis